MDLSMFAWRDTGTAARGAYDYALFNHQPGNVWWATDYCHTTIAVANGDLVGFCNHQGWGCGQLLRYAWAAPDCALLWRLRKACQC